MQRQSARRRERRATGTSCRYPLAEDTLLLVD
jgi:hypothetical protein